MSRSDDAHNDVSTESTRVENRWRSDSRNGKPDAYRIRALCHLLKKNRRYMREPSQYTTIDQLAEHVARLERKADANVDLNGHLCKRQEKLKVQNRHTYYFLQLTKAGLLNLQNEPGSKAKDLRIKLETIRIAATLLPEDIAAIWKDVTKRLVINNGLARQSFLAKRQCKTPKADFAHSPQRDSFVMK